MKKLKVLSLFDGMSGGQLALQDLGLTPDQYEYYASEIKPHGIKVTKENFPNTIHLGDVTKVRFEEGVLYSENGNFEVGEFDILVGGSPCKSFSAACITEKRVGLEGDQSKLFYEYLRIFKDVSPKYFLLENVASMDKDSKNQLDEYMGVKGVKINSKLFVGALRNRLYWTNFNFNENIKDNNKSFQDSLSYGYTPNEKATCLLESHSRPNKDLLRLTRRSIETGFVSVVFKSKEHYDKLIEHYNKHYKGLSAKEVDAIRDSIDNSIFNDVRVLNSHEMERLQGVPVGYCDCVTRNEAASLLGDGWTTPVISHIMKEDVLALVDKNKLLEKDVA